MPETPQKANQPEGAVAYPSADASPEASQETAANPWYAIRVKSHHEKPVAAGLTGKGYPSFVPCYRGTWRSPSGVLVKSDLPLFPGYVFGNFDIDRRLPVLTIPGVVLIVAMGKTFIPVENHEIAALQSVAGAGLAAQPWPYLRTGQRVRLIDGPLRGSEGVVAHFKGDARLILSVTLLQRSVAVDIDRAWIHPIL